jgi:hypothetical protein
MPAPAPAPGTTASRVGEYVVGRRIGSGGMAVVDAAYHVGAAGGRLVALKRVAAAFSNDPSARRLFLREASIVTRVEHPNVVRTYEVGEINGEAFIAMELLEGATVSQLQRTTSERIPRSIALRVVRDALRGLHAAHELCSMGGKALGLVHQDISPQNIHVAYEGTTRILDFGVARLCAVDASRTDSIRGKPCYLAPEQLSLGPIDRRADIFAMGIVLYELLTGTNLFPRVPLDAAYAAILSGNVRSPRATHPDVDEDIDAVVRRALAHRPSERFATAEEMRCALAAAQERAGIPEVDVASLGAWMRTAAPAAWTRAEIEIELTEGRSVASSLDVAACQATLPPREARLGGPADLTHSLPPSSGPKVLRRGRRTLAGSAALTALVALVLVELAFARGRSTPAPVAPEVAVAERPAPPPVLASDPAAKNPIPLEVASARVLEASPPEPAPAHATSAATSRRPRREIAPSAAPAVPSAEPPASTEPPAAASADPPAKKPDIYDQM